jgi:hypothetical protein
MVFVFVMVLSLVASSEDASLETMRFPSYSRRQLKPIEFFKQLMAEIRAILAVS